MLNKLKANPLLSGSAVYLLSNISNAAIPFALLPIITRYLSPAEYGEVAIFSTLVGALGAFVGLNVAAAASRKFYDGDHGKDDLKHFNAACLQILLASSSIVLVVMFAFRTELAGWLRLQTHWILWAVFMCSASVIVQLRLGQWQVRKQARQYGALQISQSILNMLLSLLTVVVLLQGAAGRIAAQLLSASLFAMLALVLLQRDGLLGFLTFQPRYMREALAFGVPLIPHIAGFFLLASVDRFVINAELGLSEAGIYMVAVQLAGAMALVFDAINNAYVPWLFERLNRDKLEEKRQIVRFTYAWFVFVLLAAALAFVVGPWLITLIAGRQYARAGEVIGWLALGQAFGGMYLMVTNYIFYSKRTGLLSLASITSGLINIMLLIVLIPALGLSGAAIAFTIAMGIRFLLTWWIANRRYPMPWFNLKLQS